MLLDVQAVAYVHDYIGWDDEGFSPTYRVVATLDVETFLMPRFTDERLAEIVDALDTVRAHDGQTVHSARVREVLPEVGAGWRERLARDLAAGRPSNQGPRVRLEIIKG